MNGASPGSRGRSRSYLLRLGRCQSNFGESLSPISTTRSISGWVGSSRTSPFERYADDVICHCKSEAQATDLKNAIEQRFATCFLTLHPQKTKIAYCKDDRRQGTYPVVQFDFLGYGFRPRRVKGRANGAFVGFNPGISAKSATAIRQTMRGWQLHLRSDLSLEEIAKWINPSLRGWINYYGVYYRSNLSRVLAHLDNVLTRWAIRKYKSLKRRPWNAKRWVHDVARRQTDLFVHWATFGRAGWMAGAV